MKGERDKSRLARHKPGGGTSIFEGWCTRKLLQSAVSVEAGDGDPCGSKDARAMDVLETTEVPENGHVGTRASSPKKVA